LVYLTEEHEPDDPSSWDVDTSRWKPLIAMLGWPKLC